jgi:glutathione reductase (NADPH)
LLDSLLSGRGSTRAVVFGDILAVLLGITKPQLDATIGIHPTAAEELVTMRVPLPDPDENLEAAGG